MKFYLQENRSSAFSDIVSFVPNHAFNVKCWSCLFESVEYLPDEASIVSVALQQWKDIVQMN